MKPTAKITLAVALMLFSLTALVGCNTEIKKQDQKPSQDKSKSCGCSGHESTPDKTSDNPAKTVPATKLKPAEKAPAENINAKKVGPITIKKRIVTKSGATIVELSNGLTIIAKSVNTAPVVCVRSYVRCGGMNEGKWLGCGLSHLLEHLVAKESIHKGHGPQKESVMVDKRSRTAEIGGQSNAYTSSDHTCYYIAAAASKTKQCIELIADQMAHPSITRADFTREHGVVQRELEMGKDNSDRIAYYAHVQNLYRGHPAEVPNIGFPIPLSKVTYKDVIDYHKIMYVPQNMIFTVVGDIDVEEAIKHTVKQFQGFAKGRQPDITLPPVPDVTGVRKVIFPSPKFKEVREYMCFPSIPLVHKDLYALDVLSVALSSGRSSRMYKELVEKQRIVNTIDTWSQTPAWGRGAFITIFGSAPENADKAEQAIEALMRDVIKNGITAEELQRAKKQMIAGHIKSTQEMENIAVRISKDYMNTGNPDFSTDYVDRIKEVTLEQVQAMAKKYFTFDKMVITRIVPGKMQLKAAGKTKAAEKVVETFTLKNGLKVILQPNDECDIAAMSYATLGGIRLETPANNGIGNLTMLLSSTGTKKYSADQIAKFFDEAGGSISASCGNNSFLWQSQALGENFPQALDIFASAIKNPTYPQKYLNLYKPLIESGIKKYDENWTRRLNKFFRAQFFKGTPWAMLSSGTVANVHRFTREDLLAYHKKILNAKGAVLSIYGKFDPAKTKAQIEKLFSDIPENVKEIAIAPARKVKKGGEIILLKDPNFVQAAIQIGAPGTTNTNVKDSMALLLLDTILSGYNLPSGPLHKELRGKRLVYVVHAYNMSGINPGAFVIYSATQPDKGPEVVNIIKKHVLATLTQKPTQLQIDRAITSILTADALHSQKYSTQSVKAALNELYGLGLDWDKRREQELRKITPEDIQNAAKRYIGQGLVVTVITPKPELFKGENITIIDSTKKADKAEK